MSDFPTLSSEQPAEQPATSFYRVLRIHIRASSEGVDKSAYSTDSTLEAQADTPERGFDPVYYIEGGKCTPPTYPP